MGEHQERGTVRRGGGEVRPYAGFSGHNQKGGREEKRKVTAVKCNQGMISRGEGRQRGTRGKAGEMEEIKQR